MNRRIFVLLTVAATLALSTSSLRADEAAVIAKLEKANGGKPLTMKRNADGSAKEISMNMPDLTNEDLALFNQLTKLERLTISHAGYVKGKEAKDRTFAGVAALKAHPSLKYFSAGGAVGKEYLAALAQLTNIPELYIQTTHSVDADFAPVGTMKHLTYLGIRVRNDRMSKLTDRLFDQLTGLEKLERFLLSEMTFTDSGSFVKFITTRPKLKELEIKSSPTLPESALNAIRKAKPGLKIIITAGKEK